MMDQSVLDSFFAQGKELRVLFRHFQEGTFVHAYLITGEKGFGKRTLARLLSAALLCTSKGARPCCVCKNCLLVEKGEHPDLIMIEQGKPLSQGVKKDRTTIPVEDIREIIRQCSIRSTEGNVHVVTIFDADKMTVQAQSCLLKTLEEPPSDTCMILVTDHPETLLPTVISRCRIVRVKAWDDEYLCRVLEKRGVQPNRIHASVSASNGSVGRALELAGDEQYWRLREEVLESFFRNTSRSNVLRISNAWKDRKQDAENILNILSSFVSTLAEARFYPEKKADLSCFPSNWLAFSEKAEKQRFVQLIEAIAEARSQLQYSVNFQAVTEKLLLTFMGEGNKWQQ